MKVFILLKIVCHISGFSLEVEIIPGPSKLQFSRAAHTEFVICDQSIDTTYLPLRKSWAYLVAVIDWHSRYVVSWEVSETLEQPFVIRAVERALKSAQPVIFNSDQGSHFTSPQYTKLVEAAGSKVSMDGKGRAIDNIFTERLWRTTKYENVYLADYATTAEADIGLRDYFDFYNNRRPHQSLNYRTPSRVYFG